MTKKNLKPLIITACVLVVAVLGYFIVTLIPEAEKPADPTPSASTSAATHYLINENYYNLQHFEVAFNDGTKLKIEVDASGDQRTFSLSPAAPTWQYSQDTLRAAAMNAISVSTLATVAENVSNLSQYELDDPQLTLSTYIKDEEGNSKSYTIHVGAKTTLGDSYYAYLDGEKTVYAVSRYTIEKLMARELDYRELDFFPSYLNEETGESNAGDYITYVRVRDEKNDVDIEIHKRSEEELADMPVGTTGFHMTKPIKSECNDTNVTDKLINIVTMISVETIVVDAPEDLSEYGLDEPIDIWLTNTDGDSIHYMIGTSNGSSAYLMVEGCDSVLYTSTYANSFLANSYVDYMFKLVWIHNINDVKSMSFDMNGDKHILNITDNYKDDEGNTVFTAILDGRPVSETNTKRLFTRMLNMMILGDLEEIYEVEGKTAEYTLTVTLNSGKVNTLKLYRLNERQYAASVDGADALFYINASDLKTLEKAFVTINAGEELERT